MSEVNARAAADARPEGDEAPLVVGYDGSQGAHGATKRAGALLPGRPAIVAVVRPGANVMLGAVGQPAAALAQAVAHLEAVSEEDAHRLAGEGRRLAEEAGLAATSRAIPGSPSAWRDLLCLAEEAGACGIAVGSRGASSVRAVLLGSVSQGLLHHSTVPVLVVPDGATDTGRGPVLLCYDGSEPAARAIDRAGNLLTGMPAICVNAWPTADELASWGVAALPREVVRDAGSVLDKEAERRAQETAAEAANRARGAGFGDVSTLAAPIRGNAWSTLSDLAAEQGAAVVVVGSRGLSGIPAAVLGSVSRGIATHASTPVLVVPPEG